MASNTSPRRVGLLRFLLMGGHTVAPGISMAPAVARGAPDDGSPPCSWRYATRRQRSTCLLPASRAAFVEDAAMAREMYRL